MNMDCIFFVISASQERKHLMEIQFKELNFKYNFVFFEACTPSNSEEWLDKSSSDRPTLQCCLRSYIEAFKLFQKKYKHNYLCILEDDVGLLTNNFSEKMNEIIKNYSENDEIDYVSIGYLQATLKAVPIANLLHELKKHNNIHYDFSQASFTVWGTQGQVFSRKMIDSALNLLDKNNVKELEQSVKEYVKQNGMKQRKTIQYSPDSIFPLCFKQGIVFPPLCLERPIGSTIFQQNVIDERQSSMRNIEKNKLLNFENYWGFKNNKSTCVFYTITASKDRKQKMEKQFEEIDFKFQHNFYDACTPKNSVSWLNEKQQKNQNLQCCFRSYIELFKHFLLTNKEDYICIFEDDVGLLKENFSDKFQRVLDYFKTNDTIDYISIGYILNTLNNEPIPNVLNQLKCEDELYYDFSKANFTIWGTQAQIFPRSTVTKILKLFDKKNVNELETELTEYVRKNGRKQNKSIDIAPDHIFPLCLSQGIIYPPLCLERPMPSTIFQNQQSNNERYQLMYDKLKQYVNINTYWGFDYDVFFYIISLSQERRCVLSKQLKDLKFNKKYAFFNACTPANSPEWISKTSKVPPPQQCVLRSFIEAIKHFLAIQSSEYLCILEDDIALLKENFNNEFENVLEVYKTNKYIDYVSIGYLPTTLKSLPVQTHLNELKNDKNVYFDFSKASFTLWGCQGQLFSREVCKKILTVFDVGNADKLMESVLEYTKIIGHHQNKSPDIYPDCLLPYCFRQGFVFPPLCIEQNVSSSISNNPVDLEKRKKENEIAGKTIDFSNYWSYETKIQTSIVLFVDFNNNTELSAITKLLFETYSKVHEYNTEYLTINNNEINGRHYYWSIVPLLRKYVDNYDEIFLITSEVIITDMTIDVKKNVSQNSNKALHNFKDTPVYYINSKDKGKINNLLNKWWNDAPTNTYKAEPFERVLNHNEDYNIVESSHLYFLSNNLKRIRIVEAQKYLYKLLNPNLTCRKKIGIFIRYQNFYSNGLGQNCVFLRHSLEALGHDVEFLTWDTCSSILGNDLPYKINNYKHININEYCTMIFGTQVPPTDLVSSYREKGIYCVIFNSCNFVDSVHIETFLMNNSKQSWTLEANYHNIADVCWNTVAQDKTTTDYLQVLNKNKLPVKIIPHTWSPIFLDVNNTINTYSKPTGKKINIIILEPNISYVKCGLIPLMIAEKIFLDNSEIINKVYFFNTPEHQNALKMIENLELFKHKKIQLLKRMSINEILSFFCDKEKTENNHNVFVANQVNLPLNYSYYDILYTGFPFVHNSYLLKDKVGLYYETINEGSEAVMKSIAEEDSFVKNREHLLNLNPYNEKVKSCFHELLPCLKKKDKIELTKPIVLTFDNNPDNAETQFFLGSLKKHDWEYEVVGVGTEWNGVKSKIIGYLNCLSQIHDDKIVVLSDARDVICLRNSKHFVDTFRSFNTRIVVSMELFCEGIIDYLPTRKYFQCTDLSNYHSFWKRTDIFRKFVNSGLIVGYARDLRILFKWIYDNKFSDDQLGLGTYMNLFPHLIGADYDGNFLHSTGYGVNGGIQHIKIQALDSPTFAELNGTSSFFLHFPGSSKIKGQRRIYNQVKNLLKIDDFKGELYLDYINDHPPTNFKPNIIIR